MKRLLPLVFLAVGCHRHPGPPGAAVVETRPEDLLDLSAAKIDGPVRSATVLGSRLVIEQDPGKLVIRVPGACPLTVEAPPGSTVRKTLTPLFALALPGVEVGFDAPLEIRARPGCPEAKGVAIEWKQSGGTPLRELRVEDSGQRVTARTARLDELVKPSDMPWGIVPLSPRTRGQAELEARYASPEGPHVVKVRVASAARSRGLPNVATGTRLYLAGPDFHVVSRPPGAAAVVEHAEGTSWLRPDVSGSWVLADSASRSLRLVARRYDETPLDCTRGDCHRAIDTTSRGSPMTTILQRGLDGRASSDYPACAGGCHALGEPGLDDGGFDAVARTLGFGQAELHRTDWHDLPAALRRLGGVGCLACHGPGAIPEASARHDILRADVCATCHDAPPEYGHVVAWRTTRMSRSDADPRVSADPACARCHTTWGFLGTPERRPPPDAPPGGIACAACHSVHPHSPESAPSAGRCEESLARKPEVPTVLVGSVPAAADRSRVCLACHTASPGDGAPSGTAANLWLGLGGLHPVSGEPLSGPSPDAFISGGCVGCHRTGPTDLARGATHGFRATRTAPANPKLAERARSLWARAGSPGIAAADAPGPAHASRPKVATTTPRERALWDLALVLEDPAADAHNAPYAERLLEAAESVLLPSKGAPK